MLTTFNQLLEICTCRTEALVSPFRNSGIGPFGYRYIKQMPPRLKRWACLFTCLNTEAIHLEFVQRLNSDIFIISLHRFINDRRSSKNIVSDCRTKFKGTAKELNISTTNVKEFEDKRGMQC